MKYALMADIHGNITAFKAVLEDIKKRGITNYFILGDLITDSPNPNEVLDIVKSLDNCIVIKGNREDSVISCPSYFNEYAQAKNIFWNKEKLTKENMEYILTLKDKESFTIGNFKINMQHKPNFYYVKDLYTYCDFEKILKNTNNHIELNGHCHFQEYLKNDNKHALCVGSIGGATRKTIGAKYAVLDIEDDNCNIELINIRYDIDSFISNFYSSNFIDECYIWAKATMASIIVGEDIASDFVTYAFSITSKEELLQNNNLIPNNTFQKADTLFNWPKEIYKYL